ncbi:MAG: hypothetical protein Q4G21_00155 [Dermabacter sp.]|nr:hypothetical protein [Dermabacter sp.]
MNKQARTSLSIDIPRTDNGLEDFASGVESLANALRTFPVTHQLGGIGEEIADVQRSLADALTRGNASCPQAEALADDAVAVLLGAAQWATRSGRHGTYDRVVKYLCSRADALPIVLDAEETENLVAYTQSPQEASLAEKRLAQNVSAVKDQHDFLQGALQRLEQMVEADACFR